MEILPSTTGIFHGSHSWVPFMSVNGDNQPVETSYGQITMTVAGKINVLGVLRSFGQPQKP